MVRIVNKVFEVVDVLDVRSKFGQRLMILIMIKMMVIQLCLMGLCIHWRLGSEKSILRFDIDKEKFELLSTLSQQRCI